MSCAYMSDPPPGEKSHGIYADLMVLRRGMLIPRFFLNRFFVISGTFGTFWDIADHYNYNTSIEWMASGSIIDK